MQERRIPGTVLAVGDIQGGMFSRLRPMIELADGLSLSQVCAITGLQPHAVQNWVKRGFVAHPVGKKYHARQLARILLICALRECMGIEQVGELLGHINGDADAPEDDIISEEKLYDYLCKAVQQLDSDWISPAEIPALIERVTEDYRAPDDRAHRRLTTALQVMLCAHLSCQLKGHVARHLEQLETM